MSRLGLTHHAIEQFASRWRSGVPEAEVEAELQAVVQGAAATRRRTLSGDARIYVASTARGEEIDLVVRDTAVITVLSSDHKKRGIADRAIDSIDLEIYEEHLADLRATQAMTSDGQKGREEKNADSRAPGQKIARKQRTLSSTWENRKNQARKVISDWRSGHKFTNKALKKAHEVLDLEFGPEGRTDHGDADREDQS
jgi:hypothetical protein